MGEGVSQHLQEKLRGNGRGKFRKSVCVTAPPPNYWRVLKRKREGRSRRETDSFLLTPDSLPVPPAEAGNPECAAERTPALLAPDQPVWARQRGRLQKVVTVSHGALDPQEPHAEKAAERTALSSHNPGLGLPKKQPAKRGPPASFPWTPRSLVCILSRAADTHPGP